MPAIEWCHGRSPTPFRETLILAIGEFLRIFMKYWINKIEFSPSRWIMYMLGRNMDPLIYRELMTEYASILEQRKKAIK